MRTLTITTVWKIPRAVTITPDRHPPLFLGAGPRHLAGAAILERAIQTARRKHRQRVQAALACGWSEGDSHRIQAVTNRVQGTITITSIVEIEEEKLCEVG